MPAGENIRASTSRVAAFARNAGRYSGLLFDYFTQYAKVQLGYRGDFIVSLVTSFAATIFGLAFVLILFRKAPQLAGWTLPEELFLYGFSLIPYGVFNILAANLYNFGNDYIIEGKFDRILLRPISSLFQILFETFRIEAVQGIATGLFCMWWGARRLHVAWTAEKLALLLFFGVCASVIYLAIFLILTTASFWFEDRVGIHPPVWNVIAFGRYPLSIYSGAVQFVLCWIVPFGLASFYPSVRLLGRAVVPEYAPLVPVVAAIFLTIAISLWNFGTRHYSSTGS
ncbi:MAG TPA: ABC-2 family transporter protein [Candidatus Acidoferrales bacterium]|nr:ABC-2 family transporter protein [Candidatus Acidoferrales bacterium]